MDREQQVLWLGLTLIAANFFFSGQFKSLWSVFTTKPSSSKAPSNNWNPLSPLLPILPMLPINQNNSNQSDTHSPGNNGLSV